MIKNWLQYLAATKKHAATLMAKKSVWVFFAVVLVVLFVPTDIALAQTSDGGGIANAILDMISQALFALANIAMRFTVMSLSFFMELAAYNDFITSPPVIVGWFMVRDVANMFFIVVLLIIAFATVLGIEQYEWKKTLGKLIIAAVLINFSKLILQLIIDIANIFTVTFLNAVRATAAGNLINMFNFDTLLQIRQNANLTGTSDFRLDIFGAAVMALVLALMSMFVIGAYMLILVVRVVVLWVLMILSPLAFLLQAVPSGKKYADEFWSEFTKHVMVAPLMTFFLWLTFATLGNGNIASDIGINTSAVSEAGANAPQIDGVDGNPAVALSEASTWESMSNFIISLGFLMIGIMAVQRLNVQAGGIAGGAVDFGKKVATIASGYAAGRWLVGRGADLGLDLGKGIERRIPLVGGAARQKYAAAIRQQYKQKGVSGFIGGIGSQSKLLGGNIGKLAAVDRAKKWEEKGGVSGWVMARLAEPTERVEKMAEDYDKAVEHEEYVLAESLSTSGTRAGQVKLNALVERKGQEEVSENKAASKLSTRINEVRETHDSYMKLFGDEEKAIKNKFSDKDEQKREIDKFRQKNASKIENAVLEDVRKKAEERGEDMDKFDRTLNADGGIGKRLGIAHDYVKKVQAGQKEKASHGQLGVEQEDWVRMIEAEARDKLLKSRDEDPRFVALEEDRKRKRFEEEYAGKTYTEAVNSPRSVAAELKKPDKSDQERNTLLKRMAAALSYNFGKGSEQGMEALGNVLKELGTSYDQMLAEGFSEKQILLAAMSGEQLDDDKKRTEFKNKSPDETINKWKDAIDPSESKEGANTILRGIDSAIKATAADGGVAMAGIFNADDVEQGRSQMKLKDDPTGTREYFAGRQNLGNLTDVDQIAGREYARDKNDNIIIGKDGKPVIKYSVKDASRKEMFVKVFSSMTGNTRITSALTESLKKLKDEIGNDWDSMMKELPEAASKALEEKVNPKKTTP